MGQLPKFNTENEDQKVEKIAMTPEMKGKNNSVPIQMLVLLNYSDDWISSSTIQIIIVHQTRPDQKHDNQGQKENIGNWGSSYTDNKIMNLQQKKMCIVYVICYWQGMC